MLVTVVLVAVIAVILYYVIRWRRDVTWIPGISTRHVLVTGCDTGFGYAAARRLDELGCHVIAGCLTEEGCARLGSECSSRVRAVRLDVTSEDSVTELSRVLDKVLPAEQGLWGVVNNAGALGPIGPIEWLETTEVMQLFDLNVAGIMRVTKAALPYLRRGKERGRVVNVASVLGYLSLPHIAPYCATKHAVVALTHSLRRELGVWGISVHMIEPGGHRTPFLSETALRDKAHAGYQRLPAPRRDMYGQQYVDKMLSTAIDMARAIATRGPDHVVHAFTCALFSKYPRVHYVVGWDAIGYFAVSYLPDAVADWLMALPLIQARPAAVQ